MINIKLLQQQIPKIIFFFSNNQYFVRNFRAFSFKQVVVANCRLSPLKFPFEISKAANYNHSALDTGGFLHKRETRSENTPPCAMK